MWVLILGYKKAMKKFEWGKPRPLGPPALPTPTPPCWGQLPWSDREMLWKWWMKVDNKNHGCLKTSCREILLFGSTSIIERSRFWQSLGTKCGMWKVPFFTFSSKLRRLSSLRKEMEFRSSSISNSHQKAGRQPEERRGWPQFVWV